VACCFMRGGLKFRSTPPRGGRPHWRLHLAERNMFRSTPPRGGRRPKPLACLRRIGFRSTPPRGGRRSGGDVFLGVDEFRSTPPRGGRLLREAGEPVDVVVSIHAPARGATSSVVVMRRPRAVSIHAPARGATSSDKTHSAGTVFRSTPPRGGRHLPLHD